MKVWELRQALADLPDQDTVVLRIMAPVAGWPSVSHVDADMVSGVASEDLELGPEVPARWGRPAMQIVGADFDPESRPVAPPAPVRCAVIEAWARDGDGR